MPYPSGGLSDRAARGIADLMTQAAVRQQFTAAKVAPVSASRDQSLRVLESFKAQWAPVIRQSGLQFE